MDCLNSSLAYSADFYKTYLLPENAHLLKVLLLKNDEYSKLPGWKGTPQSAILPRLLLAPLSVPVAAATAAGFLLQGATHSFVHLLNWNCETAVQVFLSDTLIAFQCLVLTVANIAYAILGLCFGSTVFSRFVPTPLPPHPLMEMVKEPFERERGELLSQDAKPLRDQPEPPSPAVSSSTSSVISPSAWSFSGQVPSMASLAALGSTVSSALWTGWQGLSTAACVTWEWTAWVTSTLFIDANHPWKLHRYEEYIQQLRLLFKQEARELSALQPTGVPEVDAFRKLVKEAITFLMVPNGKSAREHYKSFQLPLRKALLMIQVHPDILGEEPSVAMLNTCCARWFTDVDIQPFLTELVYFIAKGGSPRLMEDIASIPPEVPALTSKLKLLLQGLEKAPVELTMPLAHRQKMRLDTNFDSYDSLATTNMPWQWCRQVYQLEHGAPKEIVYMRTGVPIGPRDVAFKDAPERDWEAGAIAIVPEYLAFLRGLKAQNKKLVIFLHLNPKPKNRELPWIQLIQKVAASEEFKETVSVGLLPMDGSWLHQEIEQATQPVLVESFKQWLVEKVMLAEGSPFIFPPNLFDGSQERLKGFLCRILDQVGDQYFRPLKKDVYVLDNAQERLAFVGLFYAFVKEAIQFELKADVVQDNCKDAVDRTFGVNGAQLAENLFRLKRLADPKIHDQFIGAVLGPALAILKRALLAERQPMLLSTVEHLEKLYSRCPELQTVGAVADGYRLIDVVLGSGLNQAVVPGPGSTTNVQEYFALLKMELENPMMVPQAIAISGLYEETQGAKLSTIEGLRAQIARDLPRMDLFIGEDPVAPSGETAIDELVAKFATFGVDEPQARQLMTLMTQGGLGTMLEGLHQRYNNPALNLYVTSGIRAPEKCRQVTRVIREKGEVVLQITRIFPIEEASAREVTHAYLQAHMVVNIAGARHHASWGWKVLSIEA